MLMGNWKTHYIISSTRVRRQLGHNVYGFSGQLKSLHRPSHAVHLFMTFPIDLASCAHNQFERGQYQPECRFNKFPRKYRTLFNCHVQKVEILHFLQTGSAVIWCILHKGRRSDHVLHVLKKERSNLLDLPLCTILSDFLLYVSRFNTLMYLFPTHACSWLISRW